MSRLTLGLNLGLQNATFKAAAGGGSTGVVSGEEGSQYGFSDFSEFTVATGLPTGVTFYGNSADALSGADLGIANDATHGNYFYWEPKTDFQARAFGFDWMDSVGFVYGEVLAKVFWDFGGVNSRWDGGPAAWMENPTSDDAGRNWIGGAQYRRTAGSDHEGAMAYLDGTSSGSYGGADWSFAETTGWFWIRIRFDDAGGGQTQMRTRAWPVGDSEPGAWDTSATATLTVNSGGAIGAHQPSLQQNLQQRIAYISFSEIPDTTPPPTP